MLPTRPITALDWYNGQAVMAFDVVDECAVCSRVSPGKTPEPAEIVFVVRAKAKDYNALVQKHQPIVWTCRNCGARLHGMMVQGLMEEVPAKALRCEISTCAARPTIALLGSVNYLKEPVFLCPDHWEESRELLTTTKIFPSECS